MVLFLTAGVLCAQGSENALAAGITFGFFAVTATIAGLIIGVLFLIRRRLWQRVVVIVFGAALLLTSFWIGAQPGSPSDMAFLQLLLGGAGLVFLLLGSLLRTWARKL
ncbi:MAG: hypothetical protein ABI432_00505 [Flavobacteriales bacterium]